VRYFNHGYLHANNVFLLHASEKQHTAVAKQCERSRRCLLSRFSTKHIQSLETGGLVVDRSDHLFVEVPFFVGNSKLATRLTRSKDVATAYKQTSCLGWTRESLPDSAECVHKGV
jgi:hypothetical protein